MFVNKMKRLSNYAVPKLCQAVHLFKFKNTEWYWADWNPEIKITDKIFLLEAHLKNLNGDERYVLIFLDDINERNFDLKN